METSASTQFAEKHTIELDHAEVSRSCAELVISGSCFKWRIQYTSDVRRIGHLVRCGELEYPPRWRNVASRRNLETRRGVHLRFPLPLFTRL